MLAFRPPSRDSFSYCSCRIRMVSMSCRAATAPFLLSASQYSKSTAGQHAHTGRTMQQPQGEKLTSSSSARPPSMSDPMSSSSRRRGMSWPSSVICRSFCDLTTGIGFAKSIGLSRKLRRPWPRSAILPPNRNPRLFF
jgi:hypothetical protein